MATNIEWCTDTFNPNTGCTPIASGCTHCYARTMHNRLRAMGSKKYQHDFSEVRCHPEELGRSFGKKPKMIFVNSMSDLFHEGVPFEFIDKVFGVISNNPQHTFQILTKRSVKMRNYFEVCPDKYKNLPNAWAGISASTQDEYNVGIKYLRKTPAAVRFVSFEPLISEMSNIDLTGIGWIIVGAESGHKRRKCDYEWIVKIVEQCRSARVPVFVKQVHDDDGKLIKSKDRFKYPRGNIYRELLEIQEYPEVK